jgi:hypothetical protein
VDFSEARELFLNIFQIHGSDCKFMDCGLILKKPRGLSAKCLKLDFPGIVFLKENPWTESTSPWTAPARSTVDCGHCRAREFARARPPAAPVPESFERGAGERKGGLANSMAGLPRLRRRWKSVSPATETLARKDNGEGAVRAKRGALEVWEASPRAGSAFIGRRRGEGGSSAFNCQLEEVSIAGLKASIFGIKEGGGGMAQINGGN